MSKWQDIFSFDTWERLIGAKPAKQENYRGLTSDTLIQATLPDDAMALSLIEEMGALIKKYHDISKTDLTHFDERIILLDEIKNLAEAYIKLRGNDFLPKQGQKLNRPSHAVNCKLELSHYKDIGLGHIDQWIQSLFNRAQKKMDSLVFMRDWLNDNPQVDRDSLISQTVKTTHVDGKLYPGVLLEKLDPYHRQVEFDSPQMGRRDYKDNKEIPLNYAFNDWMTSASDTPYFLWLEDHPTSTRHKIIDHDYQRVSQVEYDLKDLVTVHIKQNNTNEDPEEVPATFSNLVLMATKKSEPDQEFCLDSKEILKNYTGCWKPFTPRGSIAFVWDKQDKNKFYTHPHKAGEFHHSSLTKGEDIRCAGMWVVEAGKITNINNSSGHYRNSSLQFFKLISFLYEKGLVDDNTVVTDFHKGDAWKNLKLQNYLAKAMSDASINQYVTHKNAKKQFGVFATSGTTTPKQPEVLNSTYINSK